MEEENLPQISGKLLAGDITYLRVGQTFIYLAVVLDLYNREVVGWSIGQSLETSLVLRALDMAIRFEINTGWVERAIQKFGRTAQFITNPEFYSFSGKPLLLK